MNDMTGDLPPRSHNNPPEILPTLPPLKAEVDADIELRASLVGKVSDEPAPYDLAEHMRLADNVAAFCDACGAWKDLKTITSETQAKRLTDFVSGARGLYKAVEERRKLEKAPHDAKGQAVQDAFTGLTAKITRVADDMKKMQADWLVRENARIAAEKAEAAAKARAELEAAQKAAAEAATRNDVSGEVDAEKALKDAQKAVKAAEKPAAVRAGSATGGGRTMALRDQHNCVITNINHAFMAFREAPEVAELLVRLANAAVRAQTGTKTAPAGFDLITSQVAA